MSIRQKYNARRRRRARRPDPEQIRVLVASVRYVGSPYHKRSPGDFGLIPPSAPRPDKTLCDEVKIFEVARAQSLLERGIEKGMVSEQERNGFPQNIWSMTEEGEPLEAQLDNHEAGTYHGYPLLPRDPLHDKVRAWWEDE